MKKTATANPPKIRAEEKFFSKESNRPENTLLRKLLALMLKIRRSSRMREYVGYIPFKPGESNDAAMFGYFVSSRNMASS